MNAEELITARGRTKGQYKHRARATQLFRRVIQYELEARRAREQPELSFEQLESLDMFAHKMGCILAGDPDFQDHWDDIAGYAILNTPVGADK